MLSNLKVYMYNQFFVAKNISITDLFPPSPSFLVVVHVPTAHKVFYPIIYSAQNILPPLKVTNDACDGCSLGMK